MHRGGAGVSWPARALGRLPERICSILWGEETNTTSHAGVRRDTLGAARFWAEQCTRI